MSKLEITRLCAEAMVDDEDWKSACEILRVADLVATTQPKWVSHLRSTGKNAQAMALVKKFHLHIGKTLRTPEDKFGAWVVSSTSKYDATNSDLNRAIRECVAKMEKAK